MLCVQAAILLFVLAFEIAPPGSAETDSSSDEINQRLYQQLGGSPANPEIETVSGQPYLPQDQINASLINQALTQMLDQGQGAEASVAVRRSARLNFEIHFKKNSAELTDESRRGLDELGDVLSRDFLTTRFILGGHTDSDGVEEINGPLSQARAEAARAYLVDNHALEADRIVAKGYGTTEPLRELEESAEDKLFNRRVDLRPIRNEP
jgi:outer membrane protein OmpA-like peptidoglycan-associated protein